MAMEVKKVNELEENNKVSKLVGMDDAGNLHSVVANLLIRGVINAGSARKGSVFLPYTFGIFEISTTKGRVVFISLSGSDCTGVLLGDTQHYTVSDRGIEGKICINISDANGYIEVTDCTGENLLIEMHVIGFSC